MKPSPCSFLWLILVLGILSPDRLAASVTHGAKIPQLAFAAQELKCALEDAGREDLHVALIVKPDASSPQAFEIKADSVQIEVIGADSNGAMYGAAEVADDLNLGLRHRTRRHPALSDFRHDFSR